MPSFLCYVLELSGQDTTTLSTSPHPQYLFYFFGLVSEMFTVRIIRY